MAYPEHLERFISRYLQCRGAAVDKPAYAVLEAILDGPAKNELGSDYLKLAFDYEAAQENPDSLYLTYGSSLVEKLISSAVSNHSAGIRYCLSSARPPGSTAEKIAAHLKVNQQSFEAGPASPYFAPCLRFKFKVAYLSDEREEHVCHAWVDGYSGNSMPQYQELPHIFHDSQPDCLQPELPTKPVAKLFQRAVEALESQTADRRLRIEAQNAAQLEAELERTDAYFAVVLQDFESKAAKLRTQDAEKAEKEAQNKLNSILLQKRHHLEDINQKYRVRCEVTLLDAVWYMMQRWRLPVFIKPGRSVTAGHERILWWDELLKCILP